MCKIRIMTLFCLCMFILSGNAQQNNKVAEYDWDAKMKDMGLVDVNSLEPSIQFYLVYGNRDNFTGKQLYNSKFTRAWLHPRAAKMLIQAQALLQQERPDLALLIYDAARPIEVQQEMRTWAKRANAQYYIADPSKGGGLHNYGLVVDVTLAENNGELLSMGTPFDFFGPEANIDKEDELLKKRRITQSEYENRRLLRRIMKKAGFKTVKSEWWHFNACSRAEAKDKYALIQK